MSRLLITTVGTSLLTNRDDRPWAGWNRWKGDPLPDPEIVDSWLASADAVKASAETNTLQAIGAQDSDNVRLLHSDTPEGRFCSDRLKSFYSNQLKCRIVDQRSLHSMGYSHASFSQKGLKILVQEAICAVRDGRKRSLQPVFCATGGFKAEIAFLNLIGALLEVEVYYIHEQFREIVRLPRLPLNWDAEWVLQRRKFFEWIDEEPRPSQQVESRLRADPELRPLIEDDSDGCSYLNAAGDMLFRVAREQNNLDHPASWPEAAAIEPSNKDGVSGESHHRPKGWENFVSRLCHIGCVRRVSYDESAYGGPPVKVLDGKTGTIAVRFGEKGNELPLRVETTARGTAQTELVKEYVAHRRR